MTHEGVLEWSVLRIPLFSVMAREGRRFFKWAVVIFFIVCIVVGVNLAVQHGRIDPLFFMLAVAAGMCVFALVAVLLVCIVMQLAGCGYSYRFDAVGVSYRFFFTRRRLPADEIPGGLGAEGAFSHPFAGWVLWQWLRDQGCAMEEDAEHGFFILWNRARESSGGQKIPKVYIFCDEGENFAAVKRFIGEQLY